MKNEEKLAIPLKREAIIFCLVGPAGSGKTTLVARLITERQGALEKVVTTTTRSPRPHEVDKVNYFFVSDEEFQGIRESGGFFEAENTHGNWYGVQHCHFASPLERSRDVILDIDIRGALSFRKAFGQQVVLIFVAPPSLDELKNRLEKRGDSVSDVERRLTTARRELESFSEQSEQFQYLLINHHFESTYQDLLAIIRAEGTRLWRVQESLSSL
jgi:guanylate kinase